ncbi:carboxylating nicotinate-nucleotide diphosphorylase [Permianibacter aggregans]|uniref:nicotinate-nucleotide diphosphorylase (carboxylating) n=2 Tax=Permianibacter aggregans TaxID=1510150 RepID=A0A4R6UD97_9GAMM|nr:carboxylating nicotinate-nucleotide diphosphorylase [Permianibacter aggregans]TDQ44651.1 nicotinate-nucleotide pyrophosphorylase [carboxylating] [Permianibacter aggregans]
MSADFKPFRSPMHNQLSPAFLEQERIEAVRRALREDLGQTVDAELNPNLDVTAQLIDAEIMAEATITLKEPAVICGQAWVDEVFRQLETSAQVNWYVSEGQDCDANTVVCTLHGPARALLTGERSALNFLQTLSGTATVTRQYSKLLERSKCKLLDTRKTLPGLRAAQKYAVSVGGGWNHRIGLFDAFLIKENHIAACGGIVQAVQRARQIAPNLPVEVEVESFEELSEALTAAADIIMLDEFSDSDLAKAVELNKSKAKLEVSGSVTPERLNIIANAGIDFVSAGALTKHVRAIDFSMRVRTN